MINFPKIIRTKPFLIIISLSVISSIYLFYSTKNTSPLPQTQNRIPTPTLADIHSDQPALNSIRNYQVNITFNTFSPNHPPLLNVYTANQNTENINTIAEKFVKMFNLTPLESNNNIFISNDKTQILSINYDQQIISYSYFPFKYPYTSSQTQSAAENTAQKLVSKISEFSQLTIYPNLTKYASLKKNSPEFEDETSAANANYFNIPFINIVNSYPYYNSANIVAPLTVFVGPNNTVYKFNYISQPVPSLSNPQEKTTLSVAESQTKLNSGQGEIIYLNYMDTPFDQDYFPDVTITKYQIEYRLNKTKRLVVPYYRFSGYFISNQNTQSPIDIILPAVEI